MDNPTTSSCTRVGLGCPSRFAARVVIFLTLAVGVVATGPLLAQEQAEPTGAAVAKGPEDELDRGVPRSSMLGYIEASRDGDYERAARYLDLKGLPRKLAGVPGPNLARQLKVVLDRTLWVEPDALSDDPEGMADDGLPPRQDSVGTISTGKGRVEVLLERVPRADGVRIWKISSATVAQIPELYGEFGYGRLGDLLPAPFFEIQFLEMRLWQWIGLLALVFLAAFASWVVTAIILRVARVLVARSAVTWDDALLAAAAGPLRLLVAVMLFASGIYALALSVPVQTFVTGVQKGLTIVAITWLLVRVVDLIARGVESRLIERGQAIATSAVPLGRRTLQALIVAGAALAVLQNLGFNVTGVLAGLGIGGLAFALAAQKSIENLFGGVTLIVDQPVRVGDFCRFGDKIGTVEEVGLRSTRVRTLDRTLVTIPNAEFSGMQLENFSKRDRIWLHPTIGLRYETTPDQLRYVLVELKKMLLGHPKVHPEPARVRFSGFGAYSLDLDVFAYVLTRDFGEYLEIQEDIFLRIMDIVEASGTGFAFPSQTIYAGKDDGLDSDKSRAAEAQVEKWRQESSLGLPNFPPAEIAKLTHTLDYPPKGSALKG